MSYFRDLLILVLQLADCAQGSGLFQEVGGFCDLGERYADGLIIQDSVYHGLHFGG